MEKRARHLEIGRAKKDPGDRNQKDGQQDAEGPVELRVKVP